MVYNLLLGTRKWRIKKYLGGDCGVSISCFDNLPDAATQHGNHTIDEAGFARTNSTYGKNPQLLYILVTSREILEVVQVIVQLKFKKGGEDQLGSNSGWEDV